MSPNTAPTAGNLEAIGNLVRTPTTQRGGGFLVAECRDSDGFPHSPEAYANARLFAAAGLMLKALYEAEAGLWFAGADEKPPTDFVPAPTASLRIVRAAIAAADPHRSCDPCRKTAHCAEA
jgi:hypothetical protein